MAKSPLSSAKFIVLFSIAWWAIFQDHAMVLNWFGWIWKVSLIDSLISNTILVLACLLVINTLRYYLPEKEKYLQLLAWCIVLTAAVILLSRWVLINILGNYAGYSSQFDLSLIIRVSFVFLILGCVILISVLWYANQDEKENEQRIQDTEKLAKEAELFKLRQQLQPHFLFNSLNSINALIGSQPQEARVMVQQLSDFLRGTLKKEDDQWISLSDELKYLQLYLDIEKVRFGNRLSTDINVQESAADLKIPALLLQPVIENAIKFGLYDTTENVVISLKAEQKENMLQIKIENPFDPETAQPKTGTGFGLHAIQRRLYLLFGMKELLTTTSENNIFITTIKVPQYE